MNKIIAIINKIEGKDCIIKSTQYFSLFVASMTESSKNKNLFYNAYLTMRESRKLFRLLKPYYLLLKLLSELKNKKKKLNFLNFLNIITYFSYILYFISDNLYFLIALKIISFKELIDIENIRTINFRIRLLSNLIHILRNVVFYRNYSKINDKNSLLLYQIVGILLDVVPSFRESKLIHISNLISDGWVGLAGCVSALLDIYSLSLYLIDEKQYLFIGNNS